MGDGELKKTKHITQPQWACLVLWKRPAVVPVESLPLRSAGNSAEMLDWIWRFCCDLGLFSWVTTIVACFFVVVLAV